MKSGKIGTHMNVYGSIFPVVKPLSRIPTNLSKDARLKLAWMDHYHKYRNARLTCRHFSISPDTFYRWKRKFNPKNLTSLEDPKSSRRPKTIRGNTWSIELVAGVRELREIYPRWGKDKLAVLLKRKGTNTSASTVGRVLTCLRKRGLLKEPLKLKTKKKYSRKNARVWATRLPKGYPVTNPGDLIQIDTTEVEIIPGLRRKQFSGRDCVTRLDAIKAYARATSYCAARYLDYLEETYPFRLKALQIDGGSEFKGEFELECLRRGILLFVLPPRSPKLNGYVERSNGTHKEEFYQVYDVPLRLTDHNLVLKQWEIIYNTVRPHQSLNYLTPMEYYQLLKQKEASVR